MITIALCVVAVALGVVSHLARTAGTVDALVADVRPARHARRHGVHYDLAPPPAPDEWGRS